MAGSTLVEPQYRSHSFVGTLNRAGRKKGGSSILAGDARKQVQEVYRLCGGIDGMVKWAKKHPSDFYPLYIRAMVPKPLEQPEDGQQITLVIQRLSEPVVLNATPQAQAVEQAAPCLEKSQAVPTTYFKTIK